VEGICSVWILTKTRGTPEETVALNHAMHLTVVVSMQYSLIRGINRMELITTLVRQIGSYFHLPVIFDPTFAKFSPPLVHFHAYFCKLERAQNV